MQKLESYWHNNNVMVSHNAIHHHLFLLETGDLTKAVDI
jgi:hypothetical protein